MICWVKKYFPKHPQTLSSLPLPTCTFPKHYPNNTRNIPVFFLALSILYVLSLAAPSILLKSLQFWKHWIHVQPTIASRCTSDISYPQVCYNNTIPKQETAFSNIRSTYTPRALHPGTRSPFPTCFASNYELFHILIKISWNFLDDIEPSTEAKSEDFKTKPSVRLDLRYWSSSTTLLQLSYSTNLNAKSVYVF